MMWQEFERRHAERYAKIMNREMTLALAMAENEADWRALVATGWARGYPGVPYVQERRPDA